MRRMVFAIFGVVSVSSWTACVGEDPGPSGGSAGPAMGDRLGVCFPDDKCKEGLVCRLPERICLTPGEPLPPDAGGGGGTDGGGAADSDVDGSEGGLCKGSPQSASPGPLCGVTQCPVGQGCCVETVGGSASCNEEASCVSGFSGPSFFACDGPASCVTSVGFCCLSGVPATSTSACGSKLKASASACSGNPCTANDQQLMLCTTSSDCEKLGASFWCEMTEIELGPGRTVFWGRCVN